MSPLLILVYAGLAGLGALLIAGGRPSWRARAAVIVALPVLSFALWQSAQPPQGWPASIRVPKAEAGFVWGVVREPDPQTRDPGRIYLWVDVGDRRGPRAVSLPYSRRLHEQVQAAIDATRHGHRIDVHTIRRHASPGHGQASSRGVKLLFYPHPQVALPAKQP